MNEQQLNSPKMNTDQFEQQPEQDQVVKSKKSIIKLKVAPKSKNRLIMTELGMDLIKEAEEEKFNQEQSLRQKQQRQLYKKKTQFDESTIYINQLLQDNNQKTSSNINEKVVLATKPNSSKNVKSMEILFQKELTEGQNTNYIQKQVKKYSKMIMNPVNSILQTNGSQSILNTQNNSILLNSIINDNSIESKQYQNLFLQDDTYAIDKYNKVLFSESKIDHIHRRYQQYSQVQDKINKQVNQTYMAQKQQISDNYNKKQNLKEELFGQNKEIKEVINHQSKYNARKDVRNIAYLQKKYGQVWNKYQLPTLTQKSINSHKRFEKFQNRPIQ